MADERETLGRLVRETWVAWVSEQDDPKPSWLAGWDELDDGQREVDMRIGEAVAASVRSQVAAEIQAEAAGHLFTIRRAMRWAVWVVLGKPADSEPGEDHTRERRDRAALQGWPCCPVETAAVVKAVADERARANTAEAKLAAIKTLCHDERAPFFFAADILAIIGTGEASRGAPDIARSCACSTPGDCYHCASNEDREAFRAWRASPS